MYRQLRAMPYYKVDSIAREAPVGSRVKKYAQREKWVRDAELEEEKLLEEERMRQSKEPLPGEKLEEYGDSGSKQERSNSDEYNPGRLLAESLAEEYRKRDFIPDSAEDCPECESSDTEVIVCEDDENLDWLVSLFNSLGYFDSGHRLPGKVIATCSDCDEVFTSTNLENEYFTNPEKFE
jgi:hypothetical protein